jgi:hypothetical protein
MCKECSGNDFHMDYCKVPVLDNLRAENEKLHKRVNIALQYLTAIGKPALGGKLQQYAAQEALVEIAKI